jgi:hypothetical protein
MKSRALRLTLLALLVAAFAGGAYVVWSEESQGRAAALAARTLDDRIDGLSRTLLDIKGAQPGYVAAGQGDDYWFTRVEALLASARQSWPALRAAAITTQAQTDIDTARGLIDDFGEMDRRAREYVRNGQRLLASDLVFSDGIEKIDTAVAALRKAAARERDERDAVIAARKRSQLLAAAGFGALAILIAFALVPTPAPAPAVAAVTPTASRERDVEPAAAVRIHAPAPEPAPAPAAAAPIKSAPAPSAAPVAPKEPAVDLPAVASLCSDLSRVVDTRALAPVLERAARLLDATGVVVWIADPDGRELAPIIAHGYPPHLVTRLGTIPRDAENVTAAAFRTGLVQTMNADMISSGAIAAPLLSPSGPVGVIAAEVLNEGERRETTRAIAAIVAAQLAALMGPPTTRAVNGEVARA